MGQTIQKVGLRYQTSSRPPGSDELHSEVAGVMWNRVAQETHE